MKKISRKNIIEKLNEWSDGTITAVQVHEWATEMSLRSETDFDDLDNKTGKSVAKEALAELEALDINLVIQEDIPLFIDFLEAPKDGFGDAYIKFIEGLQAINIMHRMTLLKNIEPYASHIKSFEKPSTGKGCRSC